MKITRVKKYAETFGEWADRNNVQLIIEDGGWNDYCASIVGCVSIYEAGRGGSELESVVNLFQNIKGKDLQMKDEWGASRMVSVPENLGLAWLPSEINK